MTTRTVSSSSQLVSALASASGGDVILLEAGSYGSIRIDRDYGSTVEIRAKSEETATFTNVEIPGAHVHLDGVKINGSLVSYGSDNVTITDSRIVNWVSFRNASDIVFDGNDVGGGSADHGLFLEEVARFK